MQDPFDTLLNWNLDDDEEDQTYNDDDLTLKPSSPYTAPSAPSSHHPHPTPPSSPSYDHVRLDHVKTINVTVDLLEFNDPISPEIYSKKLLLLENVIRDLKKDRKLYYEGKKKIYIKKNNNPKCYLYFSKWINANETKN